jgi:hypothetical protein
MLPSLLRVLLPVAADTTLAGEKPRETPLRTTKRRPQLVMKAPRRGWMENFVVEVEVEVEVPVVVIAVEVVVVNTTDAVGLAG